MFYVSNHNFIRCKFAKYTSNFRQQSLMNSSYECTQAIVAGVVSRVQCVENYVIMLPSSDDEASSRIETTTRATLTLVDDVRASAPYTSMSSKSLKNIFIPRVVRESHSQSFKNMSGLRQEDTSYAVTTVDHTSCYSALPPQVAWYAPACLSTTRLSPTISALSASMTSHCQYRSWPAAADVSTNPTTATSLAWWQH